MIGLAKQPRLARLQGAPHLEGTATPVSVLLVDGDRAFLRAALQFFNEHYADEVLLVGTARRSEEALALARFLRPQVIVLDLLGSGLCGLGVIILLRRLAPDAGIVVLSQLDTAVYREAALAAGARAFVAKGDLDANLLPAIRAAAEAARRDRTKKVRAARMLADDDRAALRQSPAPRLSSRMPK